MSRRDETHFGRCPECGEPMRVTGSYRCGACGYVGWSAHDFAPPRPSLRRRSALLALTALLVLSLIIAECDCQR
ncbi:MAG: hypothetical protein CHACPFDD_03820 [Phycisphaerae bacterium]|nr:hypothetical protein [Phycisphaerae bacterium]